MVSLLCGKEEVRGCRRQGDIYFFFRRSTKCSRRNQTGLGLKEKCNAIGREKNATTREGIELREGRVAAHFSSLLMPSRSWLHSRVVVGKWRDIPW